MKFSNLFKNEGILFMFIYVLHDDPFKSTFISDFSSGTLSSITPLNISCVLALLFSFFSEPNSYRLDPCSESSRGPSSEHFEFFHFVSIVHDFLKPVPFFFSAVLFQFLLLLLCFNSILFSAENGIVISPFI